MPKHPGVLVRLPGKFRKLEGLRIGSELSQWLKSNGPLGAMMEQSKFGRMGNAKRLDSLSIVVELLHVVFYPKLLTANLSPDSYTIKDVQKLKLTKIGNSHHTHRGKFRKS